MINNHGIKRLVPLASGCAVTESYWMLDIKLLYFYEQQIFIALFRV
jgi:hypothetical protein